MAVLRGIYGIKDSEYAGCVLDKYERNGYHDSDFYAVCWDEDKQAVVDIEYDTTRCGGSGFAEIDASEDVIKKVYRYYKNLGRDLFDTRTNIKQAKEVRKGDDVIVVRGRKIPKGTKGEVFWIGTVKNPYSCSDEKRVGIVVNNNKLFVPADYVEVVNWESRLIKGRERKNKIRSFAIDSMPLRYRHLFA